MRDVDLAEELCQDALVAALSDWPRSGVPQKPAAWLMTTARRRALDRLRRAPIVAKSHVEIGRTMDAEEGERIERIEAALDDAIGDERLTLVFVACHPTLSADQRAALTLRLVGGLTTAEIARAFLTSEATIAQRIVRAKKALGTGGRTFEVPAREAWPERLSSVTATVYLIFNEGYAPTAGPDGMRPGLAFEALRLARILAAFVPDVAEIQALSALMELQASRFPARIGPDGALLSLAEQDRTRWDRLLVDRGSRTLDRLSALGHTPGFYELQARIAACHVSAPRFGDTDWGAIAAHYDRLLELHPSPVIALNRAIAHGMGVSPAAGLALLDALVGDGRFEAYAPFHAARGDMLERLGRRCEAGVMFTRAARLSTNLRERDFLLARAACRANGFGRGGQTT